MTPKDRLIEAFDKLQEMRESGAFCCIDLSSDFHYVWDIFFVKYENTHDRRHLHHSYEELPDAIDAFYTAWQEDTLEQNSTEVPRKVEKNG